MRINNRIIILLLMSFEVAVQAQVNSGFKSLSLLDSTRMKAILSKLASDDFKGRKSDNEGIKLTSLYLSERLKEYKLKSPFATSYKQDIEAFFMESKKNKYFQLSNFNFSKCYSYENSAKQDSVISGNEIVFAGYGVYNPSFNDFEKFNINNKILLIFNEEGPYNKFGIKRHNSQRNSSEEYLSTQNPKAVLMINNGFDEYSSYSRKEIQFLSKNSKYPVVKINELLANKILRTANKTVKQLQYESELSDTSIAFLFTNALTFNGNYSFQPSGLHNLVAIIEGTDLKDEYVVVSAHYDHSGTNYEGKVYNGADDNASGVSALLEIARVFNIEKGEGKGPRRTIVFLLFTSEEDGLNGSNYYIKHPVYPLKKTKICINMDMLGRNSSDVKKEEIEKGYIHAFTGSYKATDSISDVIDSINTSTMKLAIPLTSGNYFRRSDHYEFHEAGIPSVMFSNGEHEDLHRTTDDVEKINFSMLLERTKLVYLTISEFANNTHPFKKNKSKTE